MVSLVHRFVCNITDDPGAAAAGKVVPSNWNAEHDLLLSATKKVVGRNSGGGGIAEEVSLSELLDWVGSATRGDILRRGAASWERVALGTNGQVLSSDGTDAVWSSLSVAPFADSGALIKGSGDPTKLARFEVDGLTTATTRVFTLQDRNGTLADDTDLALKAPLASPAFTGNPTAPTQSAGDSSTKIATTAFVAQNSQATAKAWGFITYANDGAPFFTITKGFNLTSIASDNGNTRITFTTPMADANYVCLLYNQGGAVNIVTKNTNYIVFAGASFGSPAILNFAIFD